VAKADRAGGDELVDLNLMGKPRGFGWDLGSFGRLPLLECRKHAPLCRGYVFGTLQHTPRILRGTHTAKLIGHVLQHGENAIAACGKARQ